MARARTITLSIVFVLGAIVIAIGCILGFVVFPNLLEEEIEENVVLNEDTLQWYRFKDIPFPLNFRVFFFTIDNENAVVTEGVTPIVKEVGPYVWSETRTKVIKKIEKTEVTYDELWSFKFDQEASGELKEDDSIKVVNAPLMAIYQNLEDLPIALPVDVDIIIKEILTDTNIFLNVKVKDYAFDGVKMCDPERVENPYSMLVCLSIILMKQKLLKYNEDGSMMFSLFGYKTYADGPFTLNRGTTDRDKLGVITSYKGSDYTQFWGKNEDGSNTCDKVDGHYTTFPPFMEEDTSFRVYSTDICKGGDLQYAGESTYQDVDAYHFQTGENAFAPPGQDCVCIYETKGLQEGATGSEPHCFREGVLDLNTCMGAPVILSFPHLMWAAPEYQESVEGMDYTYRDDHNTAIDFEPYLGIPLQGAIRIQFNLVMRPIKYGSQVITATEKLPRALFPIIWLEDSFQLTEKMIEEINDKLLSKLVLMEGAKWGLIALGIVIVGVVIGFCIFYAKKK